MSALWLLPGIALPSLIGWLLLSVLEWKNPVLRKVERIVLALLLGPTVMVYAQFLSNTWMGLPLSRIGFLELQGLLLLILLLLIYLRGRVTAWPDAAPLPTGHPPLVAKVILIALVGFSAIRLLAMSSLPFLTPTFFDDAVDNWNMRGKMFFIEERIELIIPPETTPGGVSSYPPSLPLIKTWLAALAGEWNEPLINGVHLLWLFGSIALIYLALRRSLSMWWALTGAYVLSSLPLYIMQGTNPYADVFLSAHILCCAWLLYEAGRSMDRSTILTFFRLAALPLALLAFVKNEGLLLYIPTFLAVSCVILFVHWRRQTLQTTDILKAIGSIALSLILIALPWIIFKWMNGLGFGNAKDLSGFTISWQENVLYSVAINTFFEGNWLLLFPLFLFALAFNRTRGFRFPLLPLTLAFFIPYLTQMFLYLFTGLSTEALLQTGYARGLIHLIPIVVLLTILLLSSLVRREEHVEAA